jgi:hypothetical protein
MSDLPEPPQYSFKLLSVAPRQGWAWVRQGFAAFMRRPLPYAMLLLMFLFAGLVSLTLPVVGGVLLLFVLPLLSLGYMIATRSGESGGPIHPGQFIAPLRADAQRRRSLLVLCALYALATLAIMWLAATVDGGRFERLQILLGQTESTEATRQEIEALMADDALLNGLLVRFGLAALLSVPFWHAPALVWWGGQGAAQSLFSSTLAIWRNRAAFFIYAAGWVAVVALFGVVAGTLLTLIGARQFVGVAAVPIGLLVTTAFYVSLYFTFADSFGVSSDSASPSSLPHHEESSP